VVSDHDPIAIDPSAAPERFLYVLPDSRRFPLVLIAIIFDIQLVVCA
jgi:hypothetical protein